MEKIMQRSFECQIISRNYINQKKKIQDYNSKRFYIMQRDYYISIVLKTGHYVMALES
mgnify:FL=1